MAHHTCVGYGSADDCEACHPTDPPATTGSAHALNCNVDDHADCDCGAMTAPSRDDLIERARRAVPYAECVCPATGFVGKPCSLHAAFVRAMADYADERLEAAAEVVTEHEKCPLPTSCRYAIVGNIRALKSRPVEGKP